VKIAIVGIGNPLLTDDAIGLIAAEGLYELNRYTFGCLLIKHSDDMLSLLNELTEFDVAFIIDSFRKEESIGEVYEIKFEDGKLPRFVSPHTLSFTNSLSLFEASKIKLPKIILCGISVKDAITFGDKITVEVEQKLPEIIDSLNKFFNAKLKQLELLN